MPLIERVRDYHVMKGLVLKLTHSIQLAVSRLAFWSLENGGGYEIFRLQHIQIY
jgi:hypothetical protein